MESGPPTSPPPQQDTVTDTIKTTSSKKFVSEVPKRKKKGIKDTKPAQQANHFAPERNVSPNPCKTSFLQAQRTSKPDWPTFVLQEDLHHRVVGPGQGEVKWRLSADWPRLLPADSQRHQVALQGRHGRGEGL